VNLAHLPSRAGEKQNALGHCGLASVDVCGDADISRLGGAHLGTSLSSADELELAGKIFSSGRFPSRPSYKKNVAPSQGVTFIRRVHRLLALELSTKKERILDKRTAL
jgi:hypothetical protein